jgi:aspartyl protease/PDZ domain-containing protein
VRDLFIDGQTGQLGAARLEVDRRSQTIRYTDWRLVGGVRLPFSESVGSVGSSDYELRTFRSVELNHVPPQARFVPPRSPVNATFASSDSSSVWIPFQLVGGNRIYISAAVDGVPVDMLLDSGAETTVLDQSFARRAGVRGRGDVGVQGSGGAASSSVATGVRVRLARTYFDSLSTLVMDLSGVAHALSIPLAAILGQEVFYASVVDIDFARRRIAFRDPSRFRAPTNAIRMPLSPANGDRTIPVSIEGRPAVPMYFDLGNGSPIDLFPSYWQPQHLLDGRRRSELLNGGAGGQRTTAVASVRNILVAGYEFLDVPANFINPGPTTANTARVFGNLGLPVLSRFRLIADFPHNALYVIANRTALEQPFPRDRSGLAALPSDSTLNVIFVAPNSPAARQGWRVGEKIIAINGTSVRKLSALDATQWRYGSAGTVVRFTMLDGRTRELTLADYY